MCGIGGILGASLLPDPQALAHIFSCALAHRGPDGDGVLAIDAENGSVSFVTATAPAPRAAGLLVHTRLSIIDLATGDQPMMLSDRSLSIVFNGEIYNFPELRRTLREAGAVFRTNSDTEVILHAYREWGVAGFGRLNGIFALAIYDAGKRQLVLARDPVGVKPLYWSSGHGQVAFASEIRPLHQSGAAGRVIDPVSLAQYLFFRFVPAPRTLWSSVRKVVPGHAIIFDRTGTLVEERDFSCGAPAASTLRERDLPEAMAEQFKAAVRRQMLADVPVGAFLSGGLDSSLVVAAMGFDGPPRTYAVGFPDRDGAPSELVAARRAANILGTAHAEHTISLEEYHPRMEWAVSQIEEPLAHPGMLLQADLAALARRQVKVVLTGQGADEPLGGYPRHQAARLASMFAGPLGAFARLALSAGGTRRESGDRLLRALGARSGLDRSAALFSPASPSDLDSIVRGLASGGGESAVVGAIEPWWRKSEGMDEVARILYVDVRTSLADDLLLVGDKMAMAHGLEARVPFLDLDYLHFIEAIPGATRVRAVGSRKWLQMELAKKILPPTLLASLEGSTGQFRRKRGFDVPVNDWLRGGAGLGLSEFLAGAGSHLPEMIDPAWIRRTTSRYLSGAGEAYRTILSLYMLELWLQASSRDQPPRERRVA
jgi:asparagine synthase (glutamine-hydrolysing)